MDLDLLDEFAPVGPIGPYALEARKPFVQLFQELKRRCAFMAIGRMHDDGQQQPHRIDDDMPLPAFDFLEIVEASFGPCEHTGLDRLAIDGPCTGAGLASGSPAYEAAESMTTGAGLWESRAIDSLF